MVDASKVVLGKQSKIRVDMNVINGNFEQDKDEQKKFERLIDKLNKYKSVSVSRTVRQYQSAPVLSSYTSI